MADTDYLSQTRPKKAFPRFPGLKLPALSWTDSKATMTTSPTDSHSSHSMSHFPLPARLRTEIRSAKFLYSGLPLTADRWDSMWNSTATSS
jgi:hypothetical protein